MAAFAKYNKFLLTQNNGGSDTTGSSTAGISRVVDFDTDTLKVMLTTATYSPSATGHATKNSVTNEVTGAGYTAGGATVTSATVTDAAGVITFDGADIVWTQTVGGFTNARYAVLYKDTGTAATSTLIGFLDLAADKGNVAGDFILQFNAAGIISWA